MSETFTAKMLTDAWESITTPLMRDALRIRTVKMHPDDMSTMERVTREPPLFGWSIEISDWMPRGYVAALDKDRKLVALFNLTEPPRE